MYAVIQCVCVIHVLYTYIYIYRCIYLRIYVHIPYIKSMYLYTRIDIQPQKQRWNNSPKPRAWNLMVILLQELEVPFPILTSCWRKSTGHLDIDTAPKTYMKWEHGWFVTEVLRKRFHIPRFFLPERRWFDQMIKAVHPVCPFCSMKQIWYGVTRHFCNRNWKVWDLANHTTPHLLILVRTLLVVQP